MRQIIILLFLLVVIASGIFSCKKDGKVPNMGYNYFPDKQGMYVVYDVDSFYYDDFNDVVDTTKFLLKEKIESIYTDNQGRPTIRLERYVKYYDTLVPYSSMPWTLRDIWAENKTASTTEKVEENQRYIKLAFPVKEAQTWDGNAQNNLGADNYSYYFYDQARNIGPGQIEAHV